MRKKTSSPKKGCRTFLWMSSICLLGSLLAHLLFPEGENLLSLSLLPFLSAPGSRTSFFYGENIDMSQVLPTSQHYVVNSQGQDLIDIAATLGITLVRLTNGARSIDNDEDSLYTKAQWGQVLGKMQRKGIKAIILIETASHNPEHYTFAMQPVYLQLVRAYIKSGVFAHPNVYAVDIKNEPLLTDANIALLEQAHHLIQNAYPHLKQTVGWWAGPTPTTDPYDPTTFNWSDGAAGRKLDPIVDFYSLHLYGLTSSPFGVTLGATVKTKLFFSQVEHGLQTKKPLLLEEFGEANGEAVSDQNTIGSPQLQAAIYQGVYQALQDMHNSQIIGALAFDFFSRTQYHDAWAIIKNRGDYRFPAASVLQAYALGTKEPTLQQVSMIQNTLLENDDKSKTKQVQRYSRLGLKLRLESGTNYTLAESTPGIVQPIDPLHYDPSSDTYIALYWSAHQGRVTLRILPTNNCISCLIEKIPAYTVTILVTTPP
ncbi:hypothetical protein KSF_085760 [Reticulibacter mediterranei]|uniref:Glycoside hydrolase family 5 domain-containing protein n=1 Tax=Reticulibacter mediterranei TaxID=2778369 RepID=A0A8J3N7E6_9CHLR|nr:cellulase family glycosylhydrolase [Reticulibacter mediterranei]GHO98528.1 hypothetical protein KSF_085760 [Reticulibacter mediterranei]